MYCFIKENIQSAVDKKNACPKRVLRAGKKRPNLFWTAMFFNSCSLAFLSRSSIINFEINDYVVKKAKNAGDQNRTGTSGLGSRHSAIKLHPRNLDCRIIHKNKMLCKRGLIFFEIVYILGLIID